MQQILMEVLLVECKYVYRYMWRLAAQMKCGRSERKVDSSYCWFCVDVNVTRCYGASNKNACWTPYMWRQGFDIHLAIRGSGPVCIQIHLSFLPYWILLQYWPFCNCALTCLRRRQPGDCLSGYLRLFIVNRAAVFFTVLFIPIVSCRLCLAPDMLAVCF